MRVVCKVSIVAITLVLSFTTCNDKPENDAIVNIPDQVLLKALIDNGIDTNADGQISYGEAENVFHLGIEGEGGGCSRECDIRLEISSVRLKI